MFCFGLKHHHMNTLASLSLNLGTTMAFAAPARGRTGGPNNDDDDEELLVRKLLPLLAAVITMAFVFS